MVTNKEIMLNTIFKNYIEIKQLINILDTKIKYRAVNSYCCELFRSCEEVASKICELMERKKILQNLMFIVENGIKTLPKKHQDIFKLRFIEKQKINAISEKVGISKQSAFRVVHSLPKIISKTLCNNSFFNQFCAVDYAKIAFIANAYSHIEGKMQKVA